MQKQCISGTDLGAITSGNSGTSFNPARTALVELGAGSICFRVALPTFEYSWGSQGLRERERFGRGQTKRLSPHLCGNQLNPFQAFGFIKAETNNSLFKTDLLLWLTSCCTEPAWSSNIRYFLSRQPTLFFRYMDGLESLLTQWTSNIHLEFSPWNRQLLRSKCAQSNNCQPFRHFTQNLKNRLTSWPLHTTWINLLDELQGKVTVIVHFSKKSEIMNLNLLA